MVSFNTFGERLRQAREDKNLTTRELAELMDTTSATISRYENSVHEPKTQTISKLAEILEVSSAWLMGADVDKYPVLYEKKSRAIPVLGSIAAGKPMYAAENIQDYEYTTDDSDLCLRVKGDSMIGARIYDGDLVYIKKQEDVENGEIAAVLVDGQDATLKRVYKKNGALILHAENPTYPDLIFTRKDYRDVKIIGKVKYVKFQAR